ncbi:MAG: HAMP domain-containing histidine kinase [Lachnospiraceae bacterium]|nr:HAMP domain-containing histidine kinase [Lachnospiraceae bacterium]
MDTKSKSSEMVRYSRKEQLPGLFVAWMLILTVSVIFLTQYESFKERASVDEPDVLSGSEFLYEIYQANTVLYIQLQERVTGEPALSADLYLESEEGAAENFTEYFNFGYETPLSFAGEQLDELLSEWDTDFAGGLAAHADYQIIDHESGESMANTEQNLQKLGTEEAGILADYYSYYIRLRFDEDGLLEHAWVRGEDADTLLESVERVVKSRYLERSLYEALSYSAYGNIDWEGEIYYQTAGDIRQMRLQVSNTPKNCTVCYAFTPEQMADIKASSRLFQSMSSAGNYLNSGIQQSFRILLLALGIAALLLPLWKRYHLHEGKILPLHIEILALLLVAMFLILGELSASMVMYTMSEHQDYRLSYRIHSVCPWMFEGDAQNIVLVLNLLVLMTAFSLWFMLVTSLCQVYLFGIRGYFRKRCFCYRIIRLTRISFKRKKLRLQREILHADLEQDMSAPLFKLLAVNFLILALFSMFWVFGVFLLIGYSVFLYLFLRKYIHIIQEKYGYLLEAVRSVAAGNLQTELSGDWGMFESLKGELSEIQTGFSKAVEEEVSSQRMRTELITNVSHDLKTPLTAIITYISLLQEEHVTEAQQKEYLNVLERKALRLKVLIEDLFELSKANSGNVTIQQERMDICHLLRQVYLEYEDKAKAADLLFRFEVPEQKLFLLLDGEKTYRIFDNLYANIIKYAMPHTRVYVSVNLQETDAVIEMKNISGTELNVPPERLTERFVRGDSARSSEGSGLGLAIAKTLAELQGGRMEIAVDGDLFKVTLIWKQQS